MKVDTFANRLSKIMKLKELKQIDIISRAEIIGSSYGVTISKCDICLYLKGEYTHRAPKLLILAKLLDVNEWWLLGYNAPMERNYK